LLWLVSLMRGNWNVEDRVKELRIYCPEKCI
jgi:hypothetical protein